MTLARITQALGVFTFGILLLTSCGQSPDSSMSSHTQPVLNQSQFDAPPVAPKQPHSTEIHGVSWEDDYFWMRLSDAQKEAEISDEQTTAVVDYLNQENGYKEAVLKSTDSSRIHYLTRLSDGSSKMIRAFLSRTMATIITADTKKEKNTRFIAEKKAA